jgi:RHS repeat-associated protein
LGTARSRLARIQLGITRHQAAAHTWRTAYDAEDRVRFVRAPAPVPGASPLTTEFRYDAVGNRTVVIDANGQVTRYLYDERDSLQEVRQSPNTWTDPAVTPSGQIITAYQYDHVGNLTRVLRASGDATYERAVDYTYDGLNRLRTETQYPSWHTTTPTLVTTSAYDQTSNRTSLVDPLSQTTSLVYDAVNRLTNLNYSDAGTPDVTYAYDANSNRSSMADGTGTTTYSYDELDKLLSVTSPGPKTVGYRYDRDGNRTKLIYPDTTAVTYAFDKASRLQSLMDWASRATSYTYRRDGSVATTTASNGTVARYSYDHALRLTEVLNEGAPGPVTGQLGMGLSMPSRIALGWGQNIISRHRYTLDAVGNRLSMVRGSSTSYTYDRADRILTAGATTYTVNANGNTTARGSDSFGYDQANRLVSATISGATSTYVYDGDSKRASKTVAMVTTSYVYDVNRALPVLLDDGSRKYVWGLGLVYMAESDGAISVHHTDGLGSVRALTNTGGHVVQTYETDEFGRPLVSMGTIAQPFGYAGEAADQETGFIYLRARMYDPDGGRFLQRDYVNGAVLNPKSFDRYLYTGNNPVSYVDPSGLVKIEVHFRKLDERWPFRMFYHAYIIVTDDVNGGTQTYYSAFPERLIPFFYGELVPQWNQLPSDNRNVQKDTTFPNQISCTVLDRPGVPAEAKNKLLREFVDRIRDAHIGYTETGRNSNSFAAGALRYLGITPPTTPVPVPGWNVRLGIGSPGSSASGPCVTD